MSILLLDQIFKFGLPILQRELLFRLHITLPAFLGLECSFVDLNGELTASVPLRPAPPLLHPDLNLRI